MKICLVEKDLRILMGTKMNMSQRYALEIKRTNDILGCIRKSVSRRLREVTLPFAQH